MTLLDAKGNEIVDEETWEFKAKFWMGVAVEAFGGLAGITPMPGMHWKSEEALHDFRLKVAKYIHDHLPPGSLEARFKRKGFRFHDGPPPKPDEPSAPVDMPDGARGN